MLDFLTNRKKAVVAATTDSEILNESVAPGFITEGSERAADEKFNAALKNLHLQYQMGQIPKLNRAEMEVLQFCHDRDMRQFLKEEFEKHPIILNEDGELVGENPFSKERMMRQSSFLDPSIRQCPIISDEKTSEDNSINDLGIY